MMLLCATSCFAGDWKWYGNSIGFTTIQQFKTLDTFYPVNITNTSVVGWKKFNLTVQVGLPVRSLFPKNPFILIGIDYRIF